MEGEGSVQAPGCFSCELRFVALPQELERDCFGLWVKSTEGPFSPVTAKLSAVKGQAPAASTALMGQKLCVDPQPLTLNPKTLEFARRVAKKPSTPRCTHFRVFLGSILPLSAQARSLRQRLGIMNNGRLVRTVCGGEGRGRARVQELGV